jgi:hypothetical protein
MNLGSQFFLALNEKRFAKRKLKELLDAYKTVLMQHPALAGNELYRAVLLYTKQVDPARVDEILSQAEDSVDQWTSPGRKAMGLREVAHFFVTAQYIDSGRTGTIVSFRELVDALIPADL